MRVTIKTGERSSVRFSFTSCLAVTGSARTPGSVRWLAAEFLKTFSLLSLNHLIVERFVLLYPCISLTERVSAPSEENKSIYFVSFLIKNVKIIFVRQFHNLRIPSAYRLREFVYINYDMKIN